MKVISSVAFAALLTVLTLTRAANAHEPHITIIGAFAGSGAGFTPLAAVTFGPDGTLYGTTTGGGTARCKCGTVFSLRLVGSTWTLTTIHNFQGGRDGAVPAAPLLVDPHGVIYGTTIDGGNGCPAGCGTVFKLTPIGARYSESILYRFTGGADGGFPSGGLIEDVSGALYGLAGAGGNTGCQQGCGVAYKLTPNGSTYTESVLHTFMGGATDGATPNYTTLVADKAGDLFGTTIGGGDMLCDLGCGTAFELKPSSHGYDESVLHFFSGPPDGAEPYGGPIFNVDGALYGTTELGGAINACQSSSGCGTVYELAPGQNGFTESVVYSFAGGADAFGPEQALVADKSGTLYGAAPGGGRANLGVLFKLARSGSGYTETVLHDFHGRGDGFGPYGALVVGRFGRLFGTAITGPDGFGGEVFEFVQ
ncbi:MAG TPA: choice-of-anchor tandem repeat GloVer-containing protein [Candidatus Eremiobacteraceae bacterium]|nr:choice-of-anchor tandem repeat GloVer-containing protein [Candidatus Eremiobacteraceae bacterium]